MHCESHHTEKAVDDQKLLSRADQSGAVGDAREAAVVVVVVSNEAEVGVRSSWEAWRRGRDCFSRKKKKSA